MEYNDLFPVIGGALNLTAALISLGTSLLDQRHNRRPAESAPQPTPTVPAA